MSIVRRLAILAAIVAMSLGLAQAVATAATSSGVTARSPHPTSHTTVLREAAVPNTSPVGCTTGSSSGNVRTCFQIVGSGLYVDYMTASACVINSGRTLHIEITGPSFTVNSVQEYVPPGSCLDFTYYIYGNVAAGAYHAITWRYNGGNNYTNIGEVTWSVIA